MSAPAPTPAPTPAPASSLHPAAGWSTRLAATLHRGRWHPEYWLPCDCPLCGRRVLGWRLCRGCESRVLASRRAGLRRCGGCGLALGSLPRCPDCRDGPPACGPVVAAMDYASPGDQLLSQLKSARRLPLAPLLAALLAQALREAGRALPPGTLLVPVPARAEALRRRGFNPAAEIARSLSGRLALDWRAGGVRRRREGRGQTGADRGARQRQARTAYEADAGLAGRKVAIVDDVMTTGSTLSAMALALRAVGAEPVAGLVVARTPWHGR